MTFFLFSSVSCQHVYIEFVVIYVTTTPLPGMINYLNNISAYFEHEEKSPSWIIMSESTIIKKRSWFWKCIHKSKHCLHSVHGTKAVPSQDMMSPWAMFQVELASCWALLMRGKPKWYARLQGWDRNNGGTCLKRLITNDFD